MIYTSPPTPQISQTFVKLYKKGVRDAEKAEGRREERTETRGVNATSDEKIPQ